MKQSMKKAALVLMLALAVLLVPQWSNTALAVTTPSDITTGSDLPPAPPLPTPPAKGEVVISGAKTVRGGEKLTFSVNNDGKNVPMDAVPGGCFAGDHQKRRYYHQTCGIHALCAGVGGAEK